MNIFRPFLGKQTSKSSASKSGRTERNADIKKSVTRLMDTVGRREDRA